MFLIIVVILVLLILAIFIYAAFQPNQMNISREMFLKANPSSIFPYINNTKKADEWMPWSEIDPGVKTSYSGPIEGVGSISSWVSSGKMGVGHAVIVESLINKLVKTKLTYEKPFAMGQLAEISLLEKSDGTIVKWSVTGENNFIGRIFCLFMNMDKVVGGQFERGLSKLKILVEKEIK